MINTLFSMHNIRYVISVDDCFFSPRVEDMKAKICEKIDDSPAIFKDSMLAPKIEEIEDMAKLGVDRSLLITDLVDGLTKEEIERYYAIDGVETTDYNSENNGIKSFLEDLKSTGIIEKYQLIPSAAEAQKFDVNAAGMTNGAILWLLDRNFSRIGESPDAGISLAENIVQRNDAHENYVFILSALETGAATEENEIEEEFDRILMGKSLSVSASFIYYIYKQRILTQDTDKIAKSLSQGFKRKACFELFNMYAACIEKSLGETTSALRGIRQKTLNYLFSNKVQERGESYIEFSARLVQIIFREQYDAAISKEYIDLAKKVKYYEKLCSLLKENPGDIRALTKEIAKYRENELFNKYVNTQHCEITTGDIFNIEGSYYLLVSQACDIYLRNDGQRKLKTATLLKIEDYADKSKYSYRLPAFLDMAHPKVFFQKVKMLPFDILDLCVFNSDGQAAIVIGNKTELENALEIHTGNYCKRFWEIVDLFERVKGRMDLLEAFFKKEEEIESEQAFDAYKQLNALDPSLKNYHWDDPAIIFPVCRVSRLNELTTADIVEGYGTTISRMGQPFDFLAEREDEENKG